MTENEIALLEESVNNEIKALRQRTEYIIAEQINLLSYYVTVLAYNAHLHYLRALYQASPGLIALLITIWGVIIAIYDGIKVVIDFLHIKEILDMAKILRIVWPEFRAKYDQILGKISEFSKQIGWGSDGLIHLIQAAQSGMNVVYGLTGKSYEWLKIASAEKAIRALNVVSALSYKISSDPASVLDLAFGIPNEESGREVSRWWEKTSAWIGTAADNAELAIKGVNDTVDQLLEFRNDMPQVVRDLIPQSLFEGLTWVDNMIDNTILPKLTEIGQTMDSINAQIEAQRKKAQELADRLAHPGDILHTLEMMPEGERKQEELQLDEAVSGQLVRDNESDEIELKPIWEGFQILLDALSEPPPTPTYLEIEDRPAPVIRFPKAVVYGSWDIYDFVA